MTYKSTEIGLIPEDWELTTVGAEFQIQLGKMLDAEKNQGTPKPYLGNRAVRWGSIDVSGLGQIKMSPSDLSKYKLENGDILVCEGGEIGRAAIWRGPIPECYYQKALHRLRPRNGYNAELMVNVLRRLVDTGLLASFVTQTSIAHLPKEKLDVVPIPRPSRAEQEAIAQALSDADALIESLEQLIAKKRLIKQGAMQELLTGKRRLPGFSGDWSTTSLGELGDTYGGITGKSKKDFGHGPSRYITFMNVMSNVRIDPTIVERVDVEPSEGQNAVRRGDVFFNGSSETPEELGYCAHLSDDLADTYLNSFCFGFRPRQGSPFDGRYFAYYFRGQPGREVLKSLAQGATRYNLSKTALKAAPLTVPKIGEQSAIADVLDAMDHEVDAIAEKLEKARLIKQGMMQELLTGRIRLI